MKALIVLGGDAPGVRLLKACAAGWPSWALRFKKRSTAARRGGTT